MIRAIVPVAVIGACGAASAQVPLRSIGVLPPPYSTLSYAAGVSADGATVFGYSAGSQPDPVTPAPVTPVIWTADRGLESLGTLGVALGSAAAASADGSVIVGWSAPATNLQHAFRWTRATGMQDLGLPAGATYANAVGVSADGRVVCGMAGNQSVSMSFRWTAAGGFETTSGPQAVAISGEGSTVVLRGGSSGFLWRPPSPPQPMPASPLQDVVGVGPVWASYDGTGVIGTLYTPGLDLSTVFRWSAAGGYRSIPASEYRFGQWIHAVSPDGSLVVTYNDFSGTGPYIATDAGIQDAIPYLQGRGADLSGWQYLVITGVSADLRTFTGIGTRVPPMTEGWVVTLPLGCYANCDNSTHVPVLNVNDFVCFLEGFASGSGYANCDASTTPPALNVNDFVCFLTRFAGGCD